MPRTLSARLAAVAAALALIAFPSALHAQKALVYCPVGIDATGCNAVVAALVGDAARFPGGADAGYDGTQGTVDLATADFSAYAVFVVPSLADGAGALPYALLGNSTIAGRLQAGFMGRVAVWSGTPDVGSTNRSAKDQLIRNLAAWARPDAAGTHGPGVVALQDNSDDGAARYGWLAGISAISVSADTTLEVYSNVQVLTATGQTILTNSSGLQIGYTNMASYGLVASGSGVSNDATGGRTTRVALVTAAGVPGDLGIATVNTDKEDYAPGDTVIITGAGWEPGETVTLQFHADTVAQPDRTLSTAADGAGHILNKQFVVMNLDYGVRFTLTATGQASGRTAQATFTDGQVKVKGASSAVTFIVTWRHFSNATCTLPSDAGPTSVTVVGTTSTNMTPTNSGESLQLTATTPTGTPTAGFVFSSWSVTGTTFTPVPPGPTTSAANPVCLIGAGGQPDVTVTYIPGTSLTVSPASGTYGGTASLSATLRRTSDNVLLSGKLVSFTLNGVGVGSATTNASGVATLAAASLTGINVGTYPTGVGASFAGESALGASSGTAQLTVTAKTVTPSITASNKQYDGTTAATILTRTLTGVVGSDNVTLTGGTATFASKNIGTGKTVTATGLTLGGTAAGNYVLSSTTATTTADITAKSLTPVITVNGKVYDATTAATIATRSLTGVVGSEVVTLTGGTATFADKNVGTNKTATGSGFTLGGADAGNYVLNPTTATATANVTAASLTGHITANNKQYDGTTAATLATRTVTGVLSTDVVTLTGGTATFADKNIGTGKTVTGTGFTLSGADGGNYVLSPATLTTTADITPATVTGHFTADNKVYDGNTDAAILTRTLTGVVGSETVSLTGGTASFDTRNVGTGKTVTGTGFTLGGADAGNYILASSTLTATADITPVTLTGHITASNKIYDGTTAATLATRTLSGVLGTDAVSLTGGTATFANKNVGTGKTVTATGLTLSGADAGNYVLASSTLTASADITVRTLTVTADADNKVYDATAAATVTLHDDRVSGDAFTVSSTAAAFDTKNAGTNKTVTVSGISTSGTDAGNYTLASTSVTTTADITPASLVPHITASDKVYDGNTTATIATRTLSGILGTDIVSLTSGSATFANKNVGTGKTVTGTGFTLSGADAGNYELVPATATATADITKRTLTVTATAEDKVYDRTTSATVALADDRVSGDVFTVLHAGAAFDTKDVGTGKTVTVSGISIGSGTDAGNYQLGNTSASALASITPAPVAPHITAKDKVYDGGTAAEFLTRTLTGVIAPDVVTLTSGTATFANKNVGTGKIVTGSGFTLAGADAGNYELVPATATTTADITKRPLAVTATGIDKVYDATTAAAVTLADDRVSGDMLTLSHAGATFADKNVGSAKPISVSGIAISGGADQGNYQLGNTTASAQADITPASLSPHFTASDKVYDGNATATIATRNVTGKLGTDNVALEGGTATFANKNVGANKTVTGTGFTLSGTDAGNYVVDPPTASTTADVTPRDLAVTAAGVDKIYDASASATVNLSDDRVGGDVLTTAYAHAAFADKNVGTAKPVSVTGISISGTDAGNYHLTNITAATTASISALAIASHITAGDKQYDGSTAATILTRTLTGVLSGDAVSLTGGAANFADKNAGTAKTVTATGLTLTGGDAGNYSITGSATTTADITQRPIAVTANTLTKVYGDDDPVLTFGISSGSLVAGDDFTGLLGRTAGETVPASPYTINVGSLTAGPNYILSFTGANFTITKAPLTVTAGSTSKVYGNNVPAPLTGTITGIKRSDVITASYTAYIATGGMVLVTATTSVSGSPYPIIPDVSATPGAVLANYQVTPVNGALSVLPATPVFSALNVPNVVFGQGSGTVSGVLSFVGTGATVVPTGAVSVVVNGQSGTGTIQSNGSFTATINTSTLPPSGTGLTVALSYGASDPNFTTATGTGAMKVLYNTTAGHQFLQPINPNLTTGNRSSFKIGSTIPTKFQIFKADGTTPVTTAVAKISVLKIDSNPDVPINEELLTMPPDDGVYFRVSGSQYIYNLGTKGWTAGTFRIIATLDDGSTITAEVDGRSK